jgi:hypothetical protein
LHVKYIIKIPKPDKPATNTFCTKYFTHDSTEAREKLNKDKHIVVKKIDSISIKIANKSYKEIIIINKKDDKLIKTGYSTRLYLLDETTNLDKKSVIKEKKITQTFNK